VHTSPTNPAWVPSEDDPSSSETCSGSGKPDGVVVVGELSTYNNAGEFVTALAPLPGNPGSGWNVQGVCNPNRFVP
jgi:hypothetical protein